MGGPDLDAEPVLHGRQQDWPIIARDRIVGDVLRSIPADAAHLCVIEGDAGVGKSELAHTLAGRLAGAGALVVTGTTERASIPLGALDGVLPDHLAGADLTEVVTAVGRMIDGRVLLVDDLPRLDNASAEVIRRLLLGYGALVIATARSGEPLPTPLARLEASTHTTHRLDGFTVEETAELLEARFKVPARDDDIHRLVWQTGGNPLHLRVLVQAAIEEGRVLHRGATVELVDTGAVAPLDEVLRSRVATLSDDEVHVLSVVAHVQPVDPGLLDAAHGRSGIVDALVQRGMLVMDAAGRLRIGHPLVAEAIAQTARADRPPAVDEALTILRSQPGAQPRFAALQLERASGRAVSPDELLWAASYASARGEHHTAAEFAEAAASLPAPRRTEFAARLGAATYRSLDGDLDAADAQFDHAARLATNAPERASLASALGEHLAFRRGDPAAAIEQALAAREGLTPSEAVALDADLWRWRVLADQRDADPTTADVAGAIAATVAAAMRGEPGVALKASAPLRVPGLGELEGTARIALGIQKLVGLRAGSTAAAAAAYLESARAQAGDEVGFFTVMLASQRLREGRVADAQRLADIAIEQLRRWDGGELLPLALAVRATVSAQTGALQDARTRLAELDRGSVSGAAVLQRAECHACLLAADGRVDAAADEIIAVVTEALGSGYRFLGALTLSEALRYGDLGRTLALTERLHTELREPVEPAAALLGFVAALAGGRSARIADAAQRLAAAGLVTAAISGLTAALETPATEPVRRRLRAVLGSLSGAIDAPVPRPRDAPRLTPREREVAEAAASRLRSREIAERLGVTHRTVENQLYSVYRKLGVASRDELREAIEAGALR